MSYADDMGFYAYDGEEIEMEMQMRADAVKKSLGNGIHIDENYNQVDVREIDKEHAKKLMYWYLKKYTNEGKKEFLKTKMFKLLWENIKG